MAVVPRRPIRRGLLEGGVSSGDALQVDRAHRVPVIGTHRLDQQIAFLKDEIQSAAQGAWRIGEDAVGTGVA